MIQRIYCISILRLLVILALLSIVGCDGGSNSNNTSPTSPSATVMPGSPANINGSTPIIISFTTSMNPSSLSLTGSLVAESDGGVWSQTISANDTLTISPLINWTDGEKTLTVNASDSVGNSLSGLNLNYIVDATLPVASVSPQTMSYITANTQIVITYTEAMDAASLAANGSLWTDSNGGVWTTTTNINDTLTISPSTQWTLGGKTLDVSTNDLVGNNSTLSLNYTVDIDADGDGSPASLDCDDSNANSYPGQTSYFIIPLTGGSFDYNCNGIKELQYQVQGSIIPACTVGWAGTIPDCGMAGTYVTDTNCTTATRTQACK